MKHITSELAQSYKDFSFGYAHYIEREKNDSIADIYKKGFLPDSSIAHKTDLFYMARSARIALSSWRPSSENRRIMKKFDGILTRSASSFDSFDISNESFRSFCLGYFEKRHGKKAMPKEKLGTILMSGLIGSVITYKKDEDIVGYVLEVAGSDMGHFWYSFYDISYVYKSLGMWLMIDCILEAKKSHKKHYYLGTVYGDKALYKTNFDSLEYWSGSKWIKDSKALRALSKSDDSRTLPRPDIWKEVRTIN